MVSQALNDAVAKSYDAASNSVADLQPHVDQAREQLSDYKDRGIAAARHAMDSGRKWAKSAANVASGWYDDARGYVSDHAQSAVRTARSHPLATVAIAAGVGLLIGSFLMLSRRR